MSEPALTDWLLQASTPSIRYQTLRFLLDLPESDPAVLQAREAMRSEGPIPVILERQAADRRLERRAFLLHPEIYQHPLEHAAAGRAGRRPG